MALLWQILCRQKQTKISINEIITFVLWKLSSEFVCEGYTKFAAAFIATKLHVQFLIVQNFRRFGKLYIFGNVRTYCRCAGCVLSVGNLAVMSLPDWCCVWTIATSYSPAFQPRHWRHAASRLVYDPATTYHRPSGNCTGYRSTRWSTTSCACYSTRRRTGRRRYIADMLTPVSSVQSLGTLRSATNGD